MTKFQNYIYSKIIESIVSYIYNKHSIFIISNKINNINYNNNFFNNEEIINISLVSKSFFNFMTQLLFNNLNFKNYNSLKCFIELPITINNNNNNNINNNKFKLIQLKNSIKVFNSLKEYENELKLFLSINQNINNIYRKILINNISDKNESLFRLNKQKFSENVQLNIKIENSQNIEKLIKFKENPNNQINIKYIEVNIENKELFIEKINKVLKMFPKGIGFSKKVENDFSPLFESPEIKYLYVLGLMLPRFLAKIPKETQLKKLELDIFQHSIIRYLASKEENEKDVFQEYKQYPKESIENDWNESVNTLSKNKTIKELVLSEDCELNCEYCGEEIKKIDSSFISNGYYKIFTSPFTNVVVSEFSNMKIDSTFAQGLAQNKTIKTLILSGDYDLSFIITNILSNNRIIRNLILKETKPRKDKEGLLLLQQDPYISTIDLYSLTFKNYSRNIINYLKVIKNSSVQYQIKEFNIVSLDIPDNNIDSMQYIYKHNQLKFNNINNSIINIIERKHSDNGLNFNSLNQDNISRILDEIDYHWEEEEEEEEEEEVCEEGEDDVEEYFSSFPIDQFSIPNLDSTFVIPDNNNFPNKKIKKK